MIKGILFDLDGVLLSTDQFHFRAWKALADRLAIPFDRRQGDRCRGISRMESLDIVLENSTRIYTPEEKLQFAEEKNHAYRALLQGLTPADVPEETVLQAVQDNNATLVGLSALMTTTVPAMERTIELVHKNTPAKVIVGGAVLTRSYAEMIHADHYAKDAMETVRLAKAHFGIE